MKRRTLLQLAGLGSLTTSSAGLAMNSTKNEKMKALDLNTYLRSLCSVKEPSVDRIIIGDPETEITKIGTCWMPYWKTCKEAVRQGVNTLVVHEPTFYTHWDLDESHTDFYQKKTPGRDTYIKARDEKKAWIEENNLVIIRSHDVMDKVAEFGIPFAFGNLLGFTEDDIVRSVKYYNVYGIDPQPAIAVAKTIASKLQAVSQPGVAFYGDPNYEVRTIGLGTGCICDPIQYMDMEPDLFIAIDDVVRTWTQTVWAEDTGRPLVVVNHGTSEEHGMRMLSEHLQKEFPAIPVIHFSQGCGYRWITSS